MKQPELGRLIADFRNNRRLTQEELAELCNVSVRTLQRIEAGDTTPRNYTLKAIISALEINPSDVFKSGTQPSVEASKPTLKERIHSIKKILILLVIIFLIAGACMLYKRSQSFNEDRYVETFSRGLIYFYPRELQPFSISNTKDTADYRFGEYFLQEYKGKLFLNRKYIGHVNEGDTIILNKKTFFRKPGLTIRRYSPVIFRSFNGKNIIYVVPPLPLDSASNQDESETYCLGENQEFKIREACNQLFLNDEYVGNAYANDTVILTVRGTLIIKNTNSNQ